MITLTPRAAEQVRASAAQSGTEAMGLRLAARQNADGSFEYGLGFDEANDDDMVFSCEGVEVLLAPQYGPLLKGTVVDFVELEPGQFHFIFMNPNDPNYTPPEDGTAPAPNTPPSGGCSSGGCGGCGG